MGVKGLENKEYAKLVNIALEYLNTQDVENLTESIMNLEKVAHPSDDIVTVLKMKLAGLNLKVNV